MYKVKQDFPGSPDGMTTRQYKAGEPFTETGELLAVAIANDLVEEVKEEKPPQPAAPVQSVSKRVRKAARELANKITGK